MSERAPTCPGCQWPVSEEDRFCSHCLAALPAASAPAPAGARDGGQRGDDAAIGSQSPPSVGDTPTLAENSCAHCGWPLPSAAAFCDHCLKPVASEAAPPSSQPAPGATSAAVPAAAAGAPPAHRPPAEPPHGEPCGETRPPAAPSRAPASVGDFDLEYNEARVFLHGFASSFNFRLSPASPLAAECREIAVEVEIDGQPPLVERLWNAPDRHGAQLNLKFKPAEAGVDIPAKVRLSYEHNGRKRRLAGCFLWDCYPPNEPPGPIIQDLTIKLESITNDRASDQNIRILDGLRQEQVQSSAAQLGRLKLAPAWRRVPLEACDGEEAGRPTPLHPPPGSVASRLTLKLGNRLIHLFHQDVIRIGKNRECDIVARKFDGHGAVDRQASSRIGRYHCQIALTGGRCLLTDGGYYADEGRVRPSSFGTFAGGTRVASGGVELPAGRAVHVSLAGLQESDPLAVHMDAVVWPCDAARHSRCQRFQPHCRPSHPACAVLSRCDSVPEVFVLAWQCCSLWWVDPRFGDLEIWHAEGALAYRGGGRCGWLAPGAALATPAGMVAIESFAQFGL